MTLTDLAVITLVMAGTVVVLHGAHVAYIAYRMRKLKTPQILRHYYQRPRRDAQVGFFVVLMVTAGLYLVGAEWLHLQP